MARLEAYRCVDCEHEVDEIFVSDTEDRPEFLEEKCPKCSGQLKKNPFKNNCQVWKFVL